MKISTNFWGLLQIVFIVLKLCKVIDWSWWVVLTPLWASLVLVVLWILLVICNELRK